MNQMVATLNEIAQTVYKTQETLKSLASRPGFHGDSKADALSLMLEKIKISSILTAYEIYQGINRSELRESILVITECVEPCERAYATLMESSGPVDGDLKERLQKNMQGLAFLLARLTGT